MSKYLMVIDLPDDSKCTGCKAYRRMGCSMGAEPEIGVCARQIYSETDDVVGAIINLMRPSDCPLIPVDRVMDRIRSMQGERKASGLDHWNDALDDALEILRIELGVTE